MPSAKLGCLADTQHVGGRQGLRVSHVAARHRQTCARTRRMSIHATSEHDPGSLPSSKIVNRNSKQRRFKGKKPKADWEESIGKVRRRLRTAVMKSRSTEDDFLVRAVAHAFFDSEDGLQECAAGYLLAPVSYSAVAWHIRHNTDLSFDDDFDNWYANEDGVDEQLSGDCSAPPPQTYPVDEGNDMPDLSSLLEGDADCQRFFTVLRSPNSNLQIPRESQPYVTADLHALIHGYQLQRVQDIMLRVHALVVHPEDPAYEAEFNRLATTPRS